MVKEKAFARATPMVRLICIQIDFGLLLCFAVILFSGCGSSSPPPVTLVRIVVTPMSASMPLGFSQQFTATATYSDGTSNDVTKTTVWSTSNGRVATIDSGLNSGLAQSVGCIDFSAEGTVTISASLNGVVGTASLTVTSSVLTGVGPILVGGPGGLPGTALVGVGKTTLLTIVGGYSGNQCLGGTPVAANWSSSNPAVVTVDSSGTLTGISIGEATITANVTTYNGPVTDTTLAAVIGNAARYVAVANAGSNDVSIYANNTLSNGPYFTVSLTQVPGSPFAVGSQPSAVATVPSSGFLYVAKAGSNEVSAFSLDVNTGNLIAVAGSPFPTDNGPSAVIASTDGNFLYVANAGANNLSAFRIDIQAGSLTPSASGPYATGNEPRALATIGSFLYAANTGSNNISAFKIDSTTGNLLPVTGSPVVTGAQPISVTIDATGRYLYVANQGSNDISGFVVDGTSGQLQQISAQFPAIPLSSCPGSHLSSITATPMANLIVGINVGTGSCYGLTLGIDIDPSTGAPSQGPSGDWSVLLTAGVPADSVTALVADPSGLYAYALNPGRNLLQLTGGFSGASFGFVSPPSTGTMPVAIAAIK